MIEQVTPGQGIQFELSTGSILEVYPAYDKDGRLAWCALMRDSDGVEQMRWGIGDEAFHAYTDAVRILRIMEGLSD